MWIKSLTTFWWILSLVFLLIRKQLISIQGMKCLEQRSISWRTRTLIRRPEARRLATRRQQLEWLRFQQPISTNKQRLNRTTQAKDKSPPSIATKEMWGTLNFRYRLSRNKKRSKKRKRPSWTASWKRQRSFPPNSRENWWQTRI